MELNEEQLNDIRDILSEKADKIGRERDKLQEEYVKVALLLDQVERELGLCPPGV